MRTQLARNAPTPNPCLLLDWNGKRTALGESVKPTA
jgi:hypothetical protein